MTAIIILLKNILFVMTMTFFRNLVILSIPTSYLVFLVFIRVFGDRGERFLLTPMSWLQISITSFILLVLYLRLYMLLKKEGIIRRKESKHPFFLLLKELAILYQRVLLEIQISSFQAIAEFGTLKLHSIMLALLKKLHQIVGTIWYPRMIFAFEILPKLLVIIIFLIDIFFFRKFYYFYKALALLLLPMFFSVCKSMIIQFYVHNIESALDLLTSKPFKVVGFEEYHVFRFKPDSEIPSFIKSLDDFIKNHFIPMYDIVYLYGYLLEIEADNHFNKINIFLTVGYIFGWTAILISNLIATGT